ncbi:MAG: flavodoxin-dependent (E)-4-hydroxy-3-methylbut-2-enyl-diphosphate synthase [Gemmatimonadetes bacterium]|nr:flavodoxin-dependent (E)-4-hydroxy-3-methylbut-2-enyl-diphosphate synthase [Gemmatimonadota bacterium]
MISVERRKTLEVDVDGVVIGGSAPIVVQSMTNTDTADVRSTFEQVKLLADAGSQLVRVTVNNDQAARALPEVVSRLRAAGYDTPIVGDFHYNGHLLLTKYPETAQALSKLRINPGNVGTKHRDANFTKIIEVAIEHGIPVIENPPLTRAIYRAVDVGHEIAPDLYEAVAEVLAFVYRLRYPQARAVA